MVAFFRRLGSLAPLATGGPTFPGQQPDAQVVEKNARVGKMAIGLVVAMFLFGFASIPLYRWVCAQTDPGGSSWFIGEPDVYEGVEVDEERQLRVRFNTNVERQLPWNFTVEQRLVTIHPGEKTVVNFDAHNVDSEAVTGKAVYDISPPDAAPYFKKQECFCFIEQELDGDEQMRMPLVFWFEPEIPDHVEEITLGYTFFNADSSRARTASDNVITP